MKGKLFLLAALASLFLTSFSYAKIWQVNNNLADTLGVDFNSLQAANDSAFVMDGDTLYVAGSLTSYGDVDFDKRLIVIGPGYFLDENPETQAVTATARLGVVNFNTGSSNSLIAGFEIERVAIKTNHITVKRNKIATDDDSQDAIDIDSAGDGSIITQNYIIQSSGFDNGQDAIENSGKDVVISNNYIERTVLITTTSESIETSSDNVWIKNNLIKGRLLIEETHFLNNILIEGGVEALNNVIEFNMCNANQFPVGNGNILNVDMNTVFLFTGSTDGQLQLKPGSPAIDMGDPSSPNDLDGSTADMGMFGGDSSYVLSGLPDIPAIYDYAFIDTSSTTMTVNLKIKSHFPDEVNTQNIERLEWFFIEFPSGARTPASPDVDRQPVLLPSDNIDIQIDIDITDLERPAKEYHLHIYARDAGGRRSLEQIDINSLTNDPPLTDKKVSAKIFLEGPYNSSTGEMTTGLNTLLPLTAPYPEDARTVTFIPSNIVDWVLLELRVDSVGSAVASKSAFLRKDGRIVPDDGTTSPITLSASSAITDFFVVVKHRNHLSIMSRVAIPLSNSSAQLYNFTTGQDKASGINPMKELSSGVFGLYAGDGNNDDGVDALDFAQWFSQNGNPWDYNTTLADYNLDGGVDSMDFPQWLLNNPTGTQVP